MDPERKEDAVATNETHAGQKGVYCSFDWNQLDDAEGNPSEQATRAITNKASPEAAQVSDTNSETTAPEPITKKATPEAAQVSNKNTETTAPEEARAKRRAL